MQGNLLRKILHQYVNIDIPKDDLLISGLSEEDEQCCQEALDDLMINEPAKADSLIHQVWALGQSDFEYRRVSNFRKGSCACITPLLLLIIRLLLAGTSAAFLIWEMLVMKPIWLKEFVYMSWFAKNYSAAACILALVAYFVPTWTSSTNLAI